MTAIGSFDLASGAAATSVAGQNSAIKEIAMAVTVLAKIKAKAGSEGAVEAAFKEMIGKVRANEPGTQAYVLHKVKDDPTTFWFYEVYTDQASFDSDGKTDHMKELQGKLGGGNLDGRPEIVILNEVARK